MVTSSSFSPAPSSNCVRMSCDMKQIIDGFIEKKLEEFSDASNLSPICFVPGSDTDLYALMRQRLLAKLAKRDENGLAKVESPSGARRMFSVNDGGRAFIEIALVKPTLDFSDHADEHPPL